MRQVEFQCSLCVLTYDPGAHIVANLGIPTMRNSAETCPKLVDSLRQAGADILRHNHRGRVSTVVNF